jgi:hypothetical protein
MSIRCGNCQGRHDSVQDVQLCHRGCAVKQSGEREAKTADKVCRKNQYAGACYRCGSRVEAMAGAIERGANGWTPRHLDGECPAPQKTAPKRQDYSVIAPGYYATVSATGTNDFDFWYIKEGRKPGYRFVKRYLGGQGPIRIGTAEALRALDAIIAEGVDKCGDRFADENERCRDCGLPLTDETSRRERRGPICRSK